MLEGIELDVGEGEERGDCVVVIGRGGGREGGKGSEAAREEMSERRGTPL